MAELPAVNRTVVGSSPTFPSSPLGVGRVDKLHRNAKRQSVAANIGSKTGWELYHAQQECSRWRNFIEFSEREPIGERLSRKV